MTQRKKLALVFGGSRGIGAACVADKFAASYDPAFVRDFNAEMERIRKQK